MKKSVLMLFVVSSIALSAAEEESASKKPIGLGKLTIIDNERIESSTSSEKYAAAVSHWSATQMPFQPAGFVGIIIEANTPNLLSVARSLAVQVQHNMSNNSRFNISDPMSVFIQTVRDLDQAFADRGAFQIDRTKSAITSIAAICGVEYSIDEGGRKVMVAKGALEEGQANYLPNITECEEIGKVPPYKLSLLSAEEEETLAAADISSPSILWDQTQTMGHAKLKGM